MRLDQPALGKLLRREREKSGMTMEQVSTKAGLPQSMIYRIEGGGDLMLKSLVKILDAYELQIELGKKHKPIVPMQALFSMGIHDIDWKSVRGMIKVEP